MYISLYFTFLLALSLLINLSKVDAIQCTEIYEQKTQYTQVSGMYINVIFHYSVNGILYNRSSLYENLLINAFYFDLRIFNFRS